MTHRPTGAANVPIARAAVFDPHAFPFFDTDSAHFQRDPDHAPRWLRTMPSFVTLARRVRERDLMRALLDHIATIAAAPLLAAPDHDLIAWTERRHPAYRRSVFAAIAACWPNAAHEQLEQIAERIVALTDDAGAQAVMSLTHATERSGGRTDRALRLFLNSVQTRDARFEHAEDTRRALYWARSDETASQFVLPAGLVPDCSDAALFRLRAELSALLPVLSADDLVIEAFVRNDTRDPHATLHTITVAFHAADDSYDIIDRGVLRAVQYRPAACIAFDYDPILGMLTVSSAHGGSRLQWARALRAAVFGAAADAPAVPSPRVVLQGFASPDIAQRLQPDTAPVERVQLNYVELERNPPDAAGAQPHGAGLQQRSPLRLRIQVDADSPTALHTAAGLLIAQAAWSRCRVRRVKLAVRLRGDAQRRARTVNVSLTEPNRIRIAAATGAERQAVNRLLAQWGLVHGH